MIGIYKIINPKGRIYVGQSVDIHDRFRKYKESGCKSQTRLYNSICKYGFDEHIFEIIEECEINLLNDRERYWQDHYHVLGKMGLNCRLTKSTDRSGKLSETTKLKIGNSNKGKIRSTEFKQYLSKINTGTVRPREIVDQIIYKNTGKKRSYEAKQNIRNGIIKNSKPIIQLSLNGEYIKEWLCATDISNNLHIHKSSIHQMCHRIKDKRGNVRKSVGGYRWIFKHEYDKLINNSEKMTHEFIENILNVSRTVKPRHINNVALKLCEESGELAKEINIRTGFLNKPQGDDGIIGEACDVINCAIDLIYLDNPSITAEEIHCVMTRKLNKWLKVAY